MKSRNVLIALAALWATGVSLYLLFAPTYGSSVSTYGPNSTASRSETRSYATLLDVNGPQILFVLSLPVLLALSPLAFRKHRRAALLGAGALMLCFSVLGALSVGTFYLPTALLLLLAGATRPAEPAHAV
jgi:hypothetical protein